jgi:hypothetical protein
LPHAGVGSVGYEHDISFVPGEGFEDGVDAVSSVLHDEDILLIAVDFLGDEGSGFVDESFDVKPKPFLGIKLASFDPFLLLLHHHLWDIPVARVV